MSTAQIVSRRIFVARSLGASVALPPVIRADDACGERPNTAPALQPPRLLTDWAWLARYRDDNAKLIASGARIDTVFMGDSITEGWASRQPEFFANGIVGRGISAQTTPQMLVRMRADVVALKPRVVHIMAGTNDIASNTGPMSAEDTRNNLMTMAEIARANGIRVVLGTIPPATKYWWRPEAQPKAACVALNEWIVGYAKESGAGLADYAAVLTDAQGAVKPEFAKDEVHPTPEGYAVMRPLAEAAIKA